MIWDKDSLTPMEDDLVLFCSLLKYCSLGINAASTVSLDLMIFKKGVIILISTLQGPLTKAS